MLASSDISGTPPPRHEGIRFTVLGVINLATTRELLTERGKGGEEEGKVKESFDAYRMHNSLPRLIGSPLSASFFPRGFVPA